MADLTAVGAFALGAGVLRRCGGRRGWRACRVGRTIRVENSMQAFLLVTSKSAIFIPFKTRKFFLEPSKPFSTKPVSRRKHSYLCWLRRSCSASPVGLISDSLANISRGLSIRGWVIYIVVSASFACLRFRY